MWNIWARVLVVLFAAVALGGFTACSSSSGQAGGGGSPSGSTPGSSPASSMTPTAKTVVLTIEDFSYSGAKTVQPAATITVRNNDDVAHTVTADKGDAFDVAVDGGESATFAAPDRPGSYPYHCEYHSNMHGTLVVK